MSKLKNIIDYYFNLICLIIFIFLLSGIGYLIYTSFTKEEKVVNDRTKIVAYESSDEVKSESMMIKVDIKGAVKNPGVYEIEHTKNVSDLIELAGGLLKTASTSNINLSRTLENQMVIKISTKNELKKSVVEASLPVANQNVSECVCPEVEITKCESNSIIKTNGENINAIITPDDSTLNSTQISNVEDSNATTNSVTTSKLISINMASKEELMTLSGIGESKALAIIEYRSNNGNFKSIEDIKNVSGIGDALFEKIKSSITI